jgi:muconolactone delta-isomerase
MNRVFVDITSDLSNVPNLEQLLQEEHAVGSKWKAEDILEHLFVKDGAKGAILVFQNIDIDSLKQLIPKLPLHNYFVNVDYLLFDKIF